MRPNLASLLHAAISGVFLFGAGLAEAVPSSPTLVSGSASFQSSAGTLQISSWPGATINWNTFDIAAGTKTIFVQPSGSSAVLNRVLSGTPTLISGDLGTNGGLILINPAGFRIAPGARIDASFLTLSTLDLSHADFLAGRPNFISLGGEGPIVIEGTLNVSGNLSLYAPIIAMNGPIHVPPATLVFPEAPGVIIMTGGGTGGRISIGQGGTLSLGDGTSGGTITIQSPVPEPSSYALFLAGLAGLGVLARRRSS
jgi:filamentous hemagglutinin family protein